MAQKITEKKEAKRKAILAAARTMLVEQGFEDVVIENIARKAGVAKGTIFLYYKTKDELYRAVFRSLFEDLGGQLEILEKSVLPPRELLRETIFTISKHLERNHDFMERMRRAAFHRNAPSGPPRHDLMQANHRRLANILKICHDGGLIAATDFDFLSYVVFPLCRSGWAFNNIGGGQIALDARVDRVVEILLSGIGKQ